MNKLNIYRTNKRAERRTDMPICRMEN